MNVLQKGSWELYAFQEMDRLYNWAEGCSPALRSPEDIDDEPNFLTEIRTLLDSIVERYNEGGKIDWEIAGIYACSLFHLIDTDMYFSDPRSASEHVFALICEKQHDYGHGNILAFGLLGVLVRISDKVARLENLLAPGRGRPKNESISDSLIDLMGYAIIAKMLIDGKFEAPLVTDPAQIRYAVDMGEL